MHSILKIILIIDLETIIFNIIKLNIGSGIQHSNDCDLTHLIKAEISEQFKMVPMHSEKPICTSPCLSEVVPNAALETSYFIISALVPVFHLEGLFEKNQLSVHWYALACDRNMAASLQAFHIEYHSDILICQNIWAISSHKPSMVFHQAFHHIWKEGQSGEWVVYMLGGLHIVTDGWVVYMLGGLHIVTDGWLVYMLGGLHIVTCEWVVYV